MMKPYSEVQNELENRTTNMYTPPTIPSVRQTPVEIPGVMYQTRELFQPVVSENSKDSK
jgi:hypothetical protein